MQNELGIYFPSVIGEIIASYVSQFKGEISEFPSKDILGEIIIKDSKIFSYNHDLVNVNNLEGDLLSHQKFTYIEYIQVLKDGNLLIITYKKELFLYDTDTWKEIVRKENSRPCYLLEFNCIYPYLSSESNYYYHLIKGKNVTKIIRLNPYFEEDILEIILDVTGFSFFISEHNDSFYVNTDRVIYYVTGRNIREIPIHGKIVTDIKITEDNILYYVSSSEINYLLVSHNLTTNVRKVITLSLKRDSRIFREINLISDKIFLKSRNFVHHLHTLSALDINTGELIYSKEGDELNLIGIISGHLVYTHLYDKLYVNFIKFSTGELVSSYSLDKNIYLGKTFSDKMLFMGKGRVTILG